MVAGCRWRKQLDGGDLDRWFRDIAPADRSSIGRRSTQSSFDRAYRWRRAAIWQARLARELLKMLRAGIAARGAITPVCEVFGALVCREGRREEYCQVSDDQGERDSIEDIVLVVHGKFPCYQARFRPFDGSHQP